jgi:RND family efflux transporter MFP subunit
VDKSELLKELRIDRGEEPRESRSWLLVTIVVAVIVVGGALAWFFLREPVPEVSVVSARAITGVAPSASVLDATGYVTARRQATVSSMITGKVQEVLIEEGMKVTEGQVLARLDPTEATAQRDLAQAQLEAARAQLGEFRTQVANAEREYQRQQELVARKLTSQQATDTAKTQLDTFRARLASAQRQVQVAQESVNVYDVQLDYTTVRAPFAGVVTVKAAQPGEMISPISAGGGFTRTGIGTIVDMDSLEVQVDVNESYINRVKPGQPVDAILNAYPEWKIPASVIAIIPAADRSRATVKVRIALKEKDERIVPDMGVRVAFLEADKPASAQTAAPAPNGVLLPQNAVITEGEQRVAYVLREDKVQRRAVTVAGNVGADVRVTGGVSGGERVVVEPPAELKDGDTVRIKDDKK